ncbi:probable glutamate receptor [Macrobrachium rosenbergii]|uniref:probable glutamate receptor n=1 Tax=Macrobrachium rosenbergii TaxID=79674 RepID=UPI0034D3AB63
MQRKYNTFKVHFPSLSFLNWFSYHPEIKSYSCHEVTDKQWGAFSNGEWTGMIGEVLDGKADIAVAPLDITLLRSQAVDFAMPLVDSGYKMIMKRPNAQDVVWTAYTRLFPAVIWSCVVAMAAVMMALLFLAKRSKDRRCHFSILDAFTAIVRYGCGQGNALQLQGTSERLVAFLAQMFFKFLGAYYTSFLVSSLAAGMPDPKLVSLQDVLQTSMTLGLVEGTAPVEYFRDSPDHLHQKVWQSLRRENYAAISQDLETAMRRTRSEPYVLMEWAMHLRFKYGGDCQAFILPTSYFQSRSSIALERGSPYLVLLNSAYVFFFFFFFARHQWLALHICHQKYKTFSLSLSLSLSLGRNVLSPSTKYLIK